MKYVCALIAAILTLAFACPEVRAADKGNFVASQDEDDWDDDDWDDDEEEEEGDWDDEDWDDEEEPEDRSEKAGKPFKQKKYLQMFKMDLGSFGGDLRAALAYAFTPNDEEQTHRVGFDLAVGSYVQIGKFRQADYFHFETTFGVGEEKEDMFRFGFRNDFLYHSLDGFDQGLGGSISFFQIAATSHDNEVMWNPEIALVADLWHLWFRWPVQFYAGSEPGVGIGFNLGGSIQ